MAQPTPHTVVAVVGPTATGKTALGVLLAQHLQSEVISADSRVIYQELNIGTAKPTLEEQAGIPHHMIDVAHPTEAYSAARYQEEATPILTNLLEQGKTPVVVGGTGFYIRALLQEQFIPPVPPDEALRQELQAMAEEHGSQYLYQQLQQLDPERAEALHPNDQFRIIRALEIIHHLGGPVPKTPTPKPFRVLWMGLHYGHRPTLWGRIDARIDAMLKAGWLEEVETLLNTYGPQAEALRITHGYPELVEVLQGKRTLADAVAQIQINIRQYSRRQMTWFRRNPEIHWMDVGELGWETLHPKAIHHLSIGLTQDIYNKS